MLPRNNTPLLFPTAISPVTSNWYAGDIFPIPTFPFVNTLNIGDVVELKEINGETPDVDEAITDKSDAGVEVPIPIYPFAAIVAAKIFAPVLNKIEPPFPAGEATFVPIVRALAEPLCAFIVIKVVPNERYFTRSLFAEILSCSAAFIPVEICKPVIGEVVPIPTLPAFVTVSVVVPLLFTTFNPKERNDKGNHAILGLREKRKLPDVVENEAPSP